MTGSRVIKASMLWVMALAACGSTADRSGTVSATDAEAVQAAGPQQRRVTGGALSVAVRTIPGNYIRAFACDFDENPIAAMERYHNTLAGRAARAGDLKLLRSLGFNREAHDGDLESLGGKVTAPPGLTILGLPVRLLRINGMIGDVNSMYITTFAKGVTVDQVVRAAKLELDQKSYKQYKLRHYSRHISNEPVTELTLDDEGDGVVELVCQVRGTPD